MSSQLIIIFLYLFCVFVGFVFIHVFMYVIFIQYCILWSLINNYFAQNNKIFLYFYVSLCSCVLLCVCSETAEHIKSNIFKVSSLKQFRNVII